MTGACAADLIVVGASFAGLACARAAALAGLHVVLLEKKAAAGEKLHTTGLVVKDAVDRVEWLADVPPALVKRIDGVRLYAPNLRHVDLFAPGYWFWATDTPRLMDWMLDVVRGVGVEARMGTTFVDAARDGDGWRVRCGDGTELRTRYLVGADGPHSRVAKSLGLSSNTQFLFGVEHEHAGAQLAPGLLHCFVDKQVAPGYIGWAFDGVGVAQVGLARRLPHGQASASIGPFLRKVAPFVTVQGAPLAVRAGMIPCGGLLPRVALPGALLVGDAAGMVSPVTAGGIHTALRHGEQVGASVAAFLRGEKDDPAQWLVASYPRFRAKRALRWMFDRFQSDWLFNRMLSTAPMRRAAELVYFHRKGGVRLD